MLTALLLPTSNFYFYLAFLLLHKINLQKLQVLYS